MIKFKILAISKILSHSNMIKFKYCPIQILSNGDAFENFGYKSNIFPFKYDPFKYDQIKYDQIKYCQTGTLLKILAISQMQDALRASFHSSLLASNIRIQIWLHSNMIVQIWSHSNMIAFKYDCSNMIGSNIVQLGPFWKFWL